MSHTAAITIASLALALAAFLGASVVIGQSPRGALGNPTSLLGVETQTSEVATTPEAGPLATDSSRVGRPVLPDL